MLCSLLFFCVSELFVCSVVLVCFGGECFVCACFLVFCFLLLDRFGVLVVGVCVWMYSWFVGVVL